MPLSEEQRRIGWINTRDVAAHVRKYIAHRKRTLRVLDDAGVALAQQMFGPVGLHKLREVSRATGYSPTYLSRVLNGHVPISPEAYVALADWFYRKKRRKE
jgi:AraC-like DNA-binding protein